MKVYLRKCREFKIAPNDGAILQLRVAMASDEGEFIRIEAAKNNKLNFNKPLKDIGLIALATSLEHFSE